MNKNIGTADRIIRILVGTAIIWLYLSNQISGILAVVLLAVAAIFVVTSFISVCPIYLLFGWSTRNKKKIQQSV